MPPKLRNTLETLAFIALVLSVWLLVPVQS